jgi:hypothetical protein
MSQELQIQRVLTNVRALKTPLEKYSHLIALLVRQTAHCVCVGAAHHKQH